ncbi:hypothetical protein [Serinicoccus sp. LYQ131]|uniref:hypothetical protein n=1 Tax=Serinicoccus sp. LYQ131 TaxID=3378797 RepID=UPI003853E2C8
MGIVNEFGRALLKPLGAPTGPVQCFLEVPFEVGEKRWYPDGLIRVTRGKSTWTALVEVKTGKNSLTAEQIEKYLDICRAEGFDALITISNEIPVAWGEHPTKVDKRKLKRVDLHHWSWTFVLSTAVMQKEHRGVSDPEQAWILGELIRYLEHPRSGALEFDDMGPYWVGVRQAVRTGTLRPTDKGTDQVVAQFDALLRFVSLRLGRQLGTDVVHVRSRREASDPAVRAQALLESVVRDGVLSGAVRIPDTVGPITISTDLRAGTVTCHVDVRAPGEGRPKTRVNWVVRQLKEAPGDTRLEAFFANARGPGTAELLHRVREDPTVLVPVQKEIRSFRVAQVSTLGTKRGRGQGSFIDSVVEAVDQFYAQVMQQLKPWAARPPRLRQPEIEETEPADLSSTALSSQDGAEEAAGPVASPRPGAGAPALRE